MFIILCCCCWCYSVSFASVSIRTSLYAFVICVYLFLLLFLVLLSHWMSLNLIHINIIIKWGINLLLFSANIVLVLSRFDSSLGDERQSIESTISKFIDDFWIFECFVCLSFLVPFMIVTYWVTTKKILISRVFFYIYTRKKFQCTFNETFFNISCETVCKMHWNDKKHVSRPLLLS